MFQEPAEPFRANDPLHGHWPRERWRYACQRRSVVQRWMSVHPTKMRHDFGQERPQVLLAANEIVIQAFLPHRLHLTIGIQILVWSVAYRQNECFRLE